MGFIRNVFITPASCINASRPIPGEKDLFLGVARVSDDLVRFLNMTKFADPMTVQAGVWAITDGYRQADVQARLVSRNSHGETHPAISDNQVAEARRLLDALGISHKL